MLVFVDIDGTLADCAERFKKAGPEPRERGVAYWEWLKNVQNPESVLKDTAIPGMLELTNALNSGLHIDIYYLTGREESYAEATTTWLKRKDFPAPVDLIMRPIGDIRDNGTFKENAIKSVLARRMYNIYPVVVIDDDYTGEIQSVCKKNGWTFLKAMSGGYWNE